MSQHKDYGLSKLENTKTDNKKKKNLESYLNNENFSEEGGRLEEMHQKAHC